MLRRRSTLLIVTGLLAIGNGATSRAQAPIIVARATLGDRTLTVTGDDLRVELMLARRGGNGVPVAVNTPVREAVLQSVLRRKLLAAEAERRRRDADASVGALIARASEGVLAEVEVLRATNAVDVSDASVRVFYDGHGADFQSVPQRKVRHIVVATEAEARAARAEIAAGAGFEAVARARNTDATAASGGDLGWVAQRAMVKAFDDMVFALDRGTIGGPVQTAMGWHLVLIEDVDPGKLLPLPLVRDRVIEAMRQDAVNALTKRLFEEAKPIIDRALLADVLQ